MSVGEFSDPSEKAMSQKRKQEDELRKQKPNRRRKSQMDGFLKL